MSVRSSSEDALIQEQRSNPGLFSARYPEYWVSDKPVLIFLPNEFDTMTDKLPEFEIYKTPKERVKIILDTFKLTNFNALYADYLWLYSNENCENQLVALSHFHKLPDIEEIYKWFKYWKEKEK